MAVSGPATAPAPLQAAGASSPAGPRRGPDTISVVLPTYNRAPALAATLPSLLAVHGVGELVVVDDGSRDATADVLAAHPDPRLRVVRHVRNRGVTAARNSGSAAAGGTWLLFAEDDCSFPADYAEQLLAEAHRWGADVVGAPMVHPLPGQPPDLAAATARVVACGDGGLDGVARFPTTTRETPLLQAPSLVRREVWRRLRFDEAYAGNAYREETDFFVRAARAGYRCILTPRTWFWEAARWPGGQPRTLLRSEWWTWRNNWRFLRRHQPWLADQGYLRQAAAAPAAREQAAFAVRRLRALPSRACTARHARRAAAARLRGEAAARRRDDARP